MGKEGVGGFLDSKEAKVGVLLLFSILLVFVLTLSMSAIFVSAVNVTIKSPGNYTLNASTSRNINITFNANWTLGDFDNPQEHENVSNCTLYIDSTDLKIAWDSVLNLSVDTVNISTKGGVVSEFYNISNASMSYMNFTFPADGNYTFGVGCLNATNSSNVAGYTFSGNFSVFVDASAPAFNFTSPLNLSFNTSSTTTAKINFTVNDTGLGMNWTNNNSINLSIHLGGSKVKLFTYNQSDFVNLSCTAPSTDVSKATSRCNSTYAFNSNGTYIINVTAVDALGTFGFSTITFTVDQIAPRLRNFSITNGSETSLADISFNKSVLGNSTGGGVPVSGDGTTAQGLTITAFGNFTDNLTRPLEATFQLLNGSVWQTLNTTKDAITNNITSSATNQFGIVNFTFPIPAGHNQFEGKNITFRMFANDTLGNVNNSDNSASSVNLTILINDTTAPTVEITLPIVNGTNTSSTILTVNWTISENNPLTEINISVDGVGSSNGVDDGCQRYKRYTTTGATLVNDIKNGTWSTLGGGTCGLTNGSHYVIVQSTDSWGNSFEENVTFNVQSGTIPGLGFNLTNALGIGAWNKSAINKSNITSGVGISLYGFDGLGSSINKVSYFSSCDSTVRVENNGTIIYPFNASSCNTLSGNRTVTVTINDTAGNANTTVLGFLVDNVAPTLTVNQPTDGEIFANVESIFNLTVLDNDQGISSFGYYLDGSNVVIMFNISNSGSIGGAGASANQSNTTNLTGVHTIKFTVNDTLGNAVNSSVRTFTQLGSVNVNKVARTLNGTIGGNNVSNISLFNSTGGLIISGELNSNQTLELFIALNRSASGDRAGANITINFNGTAANWNKTDEIFFQLNESVTAAFLKTNYSTNVLDMVYSNNFTQFLANSSYYAKIRMTLNASELGRNGTQLLYFPDESNLKISPSASNITQCAFDFSPTHSATSGLPCWNTTNNKSVDIFIPHFSVVALVNDTSNPTINVTAPLSNHTSSMFNLNITVSADTVSCSYSINTTLGNANETMTLSGTTCLGQTERFKNLEAVRPSAYNITFYATDAGGNVNTYLWDFNISDTTRPNTPNSTRVSTSVTSTTATITISDINETVNATVLMANGSSVAGGTQTDFNTTQVVSLTSLSASTTYHFNVSVCDYAGNCAQNSTGLSLTTSAAASTSTSTTTSSSSGGGGGAATTTSAVVDSKAQVWSKIPEGSSVTLNVGKATIAVTQVAVNDVKSELSNVELEVASLDKNPVSEEASSKVYQYLKINKKNLKDSDAASFKVAFRVTKTWLTENSIASGDVALYRYNNGWNELTTKVASTDSTYVNYEADTPGFSSFAVGAKSSVAPPVKEEAPKEEAKPEEKVPEIVPKEEKPVPLTGPGKAPTAWIIAAIVVILGIVMIVAYQKNKKKI